MFTVGKTVLRDRQVLHSWQFSVVSAFALSNAVVHRVSPVEFVLGFEVKVVVTGAGAQDPRGTSEL